MKVTYNWLKDFVEIKISAKALADKLTMAGLEVTSLEEKDQDFVFEIEVTANRPDCLSVIGIAREVAAVTNSKFKLPQATGHKPQATGHRPQATGHKPAACSLQPVSIKIEDKKDCPLYTAKIITDVRVTESPGWLKKRLELVGCRSVNNIVDITNYILFEWGQPLHAFDLAKLANGKIIIRRAKDNERIITIDEETRNLNKDILVIADNKKPIAIAGVMGGKETEVTGNTKNILLEVAVFNPIIVRHARQRLGIQSESSYRFERGIDPSVLELASWQATELIQKTTGARCVLAKRAGAFKRKTKSISLDVSFAQKILGINLGSPSIKKILNNLGFKVKPKTGNLIVRVPSHRLDVSQDVDLIEEIARVSGYENIPKTKTSLIPQITTDNTRGLVSLIKTTLTGLGLNEVITYSLIDKDLLKEVKAEKLSQPTEILNPLSKEQAVLRPTLIPSLARCVAYNLNQKQDYINIFEIAKTFSETSKSQEELTLGIALCGTRSFFVSEQGSINEKIGPWHLKGILEALFRRLGIKDYSLNAAQGPYEIAVYVNKEKMGIITGLDKSTLDYLDIKNREVWLLELSLERVLSCADLKKRFTAVPTYPGITRDISLIIKEEIPAKDVLGVIRQKGEPLLCEVKIIDYYKGKQIPQGFRGLTISCLYRSDTRTLTEAEVNPIHALVSSALVERFGAQIR
jgi:phenylalanyl-tRNA synthetase beta chain